ncbi:MAG: hypothetical protein ABSA93_15450 [Streptosporangiaceae bacterium]|jgi:TorA maturation chaperone TorD
MISYRQQCQLRRIEADLRESDPHLAGMLGLFAWLHADQAPPAQEQDRSRLYVWLTGVLTAAAAAITRRARIPGAGLELSRHKLEAGDQQNPPATG